MSRWTRGPGRDLAGLLLALLVSALALSVIAGLSGVARADGRTRILLIAEPGQLRVRYSLSAGVTRFRLANVQQAIQSDTWRIDTAGLKLDKGEVSDPTGTPFKTFDILIRPDSKQRDRIYPALSRIGSQGWLVYAAYLQPQDSSADLSVAPRPGWVGLQPEGTRLQTRGYAYYGPEAQVTRGRVTVIAASDTPAWLSRSIREDADSAIGFYTHRLGVTLRRKPMLIIGYEPDTGVGWRGDTSEGVVAVRFYSARWLKESEEWRGLVSKFVSHEFFHLWNGQIFAPKENDRDAWLHEGGADYAALMAARASGRLSDTVLRDELGRSFNGCARWLGAKGVVASPPQGGSAIYECGMLAQWLADLQTRSVSGGRNDVLDVWAAVFEIAAHQGHRYGVSDFLLKTWGRDAPGTLIRRLTEPGDKTRWTDLARAMAPYGVTVEPARSAELDRGALIFHVLRQSCATGSVGFWTEPDHLKLDSAGACGTITGSPLVDSVLGHSLMTDAPGAFDAVAAACLAKAPVVFSYQGKPVGTAKCAKPLGDHPVAWKVVRTTAP
jgi:hypothetical protein